MDSPDLAMDPRLSRSARLTILLIAFLLLCAGIAFAGEKPFGGIGLQVVPTIEGDLVVLNVVERSPAAEAGLLPGDLIIKVDDFVLKGSDFTEVVSRYLWGEPGTKVTLTYFRPGKEGMSSAVLQRVPLDTNVGGPAGVRMLTPENR